MRFSVKGLAAALVKLGSSQLCSMLLMAIANKTLAIMVGPDGLGLFSIIRNAQQILTTISVFGAQNSIVQGYASTSESQRKSFLSTIFCIMSLILFGIVIIACLFSKFFGELFLSDKLSYLFPWLVFPLIASTEMIFLRAILNVNFDITALSLTNIATGVGAVLSVIPLSILYNTGYTQALVFILAITYGSGFCYAFYIVYTRSYLAGLLYSFKEKINTEAIRVFIIVGAPTLISSTLGLFVVLIIRKKIEASYSMASVGYFDVAWSCSSLYLSLFLSSLQAYLLPLLSAAKNCELSALLSKSLRISLIFLLPIIVILIVFKSLLIQILYSYDFIIATELMQWTLPGDYIRVCGWIFATGLLSRADMGAYLFIESVWNVCFFVISYFLLSSSLLFIGHAYIISYLVYLILHYIRSHYCHNIKIDFRTTCAGIFGLAIIVISSLLTWGNLAASWSKLFIILSALIYSISFMTKSERKITFSLIINFISNFGGYKLK